MNVDVFFYVDFVLINFESKFVDLFFFEKKSERTNEVALNDEGSRVEWGRMRANRRSIVSRIAHST